MCFGKKASSIVEHKAIFRTDGPSSQHRHADQSTGKLTQGWSDFELKGGKLT
jgi:hypothetical protein